jgi:hypothetical protein
LESVKEHLPTESTIAFGAAIAALAAVLTLPGLLRAPQKLDTEGKDEQFQFDNKSKVIPAIVSAALFSLGLKISGMTVSSKIYGFLNVKGIKDGSWDPTLACVMGGGLVVSFLSYQWVKGFNIVKVCALHTHVICQIVVWILICSLILLCEMKRMLRPSNAHLA